MKLKNKKLYIFLTIYFIVNILFLTKFPFMHSDESWLSGLTRNMAESKNLGVTETFFNLDPRYPHAIKSIFHLIQVVFLSLFGYNLFSFRLMSLIFSVLTIYLFNIITQKVINRSSILFTIVFALDIQFIYAAHFARQEIIILFLFLLAFNFALSKQVKSAAVILGLSIGIHPNAFIISLAIGLYLLNLLSKKELKTKDILKFIGILSIFAVFFILLSFSFDSNFITHYQSFGSQFEVTSSFSHKVQEFKNFYLKLYYQISITYYNPFIKVQLITFAITFIISLFSLKENLDLIIMIIGVNFAILLIGRFNPTSIILIFPLCYLLLFRIIIKLKFGNYLIVLLIILNFINSSLNIYPYLSHSYENYLTNLDGYDLENSKVLANLNLEYYFDNGNLLDYRNLYYLKDNNLTISEYLKVNQIEYIIYSEEMDFIYNNRPTYNAVYGNTYYYYQDFKDFLENNCTIITNFKDNLYSIRIVRYQLKEDYQVTVYKINNY